MIKRLLVANRGGIAVRIMATAVVLGIETVELPGTGVAAYPDVGAAAGMGCDMLHPGYGFLSEQPRLAERCAGAGVRLVGPRAGALALFGDKTATRARAREHGAVMVKAVAGGGGRGLHPLVTRRGSIRSASQGHCPGRRRSP